MKLLKSALVLLPLALSFLNCSSRNDEDTQRNDNLTILKTTSVESKEVKPLGEATKILIKYELKNSCEKLQKIELISENQKNLQYRVVGVQPTDKMCAQVIDIKEESFDFKAKEEGTYNLNFLTGKDDNGKDVYTSLKLEIKKK